MGKRKICVITGTRAEYGLLYWTLRGLKEDPAFQLQLCVTGMHLSPEHGLTWKVIEEDGFTIDRKIDSQLGSDTPAGISRSTGLTLIGFAQALEELQPHLVVVAGDRFETFAAASAASIAGIPLAHCHGGELTFGAFDDSLRHAITKLSHLHFCATLTYRNRIVQLGENPEHVFVTGALGIEHLHKLPLLQKEEFEEKIAFKLGPRNLLVTFHPVTRETRHTADHVEALLAVLRELSDTHILFTLPNADTGNHTIRKQITDYVKASEGKAIAFTSMGQLNYLSALQYVDAVVGNSSSGIIEAPSFRIGTINIGSRQEGRIKPASVIDCQPDVDSITAAFHQLYSQPFRQTLKKATNPYDQGNPSETILRVLKEVPLDPLIKKAFFDMTRKIRD